jgi:hypothetical protein
MPTKLAGATKRLQAAQRNFVKVHKEHARKAKRASGSSVAGRTKQKFGVKAARWMREHPTQVKRMKNAIAKGQSVSGYLTRKASGSSVAGRTRRRKKASGSSVAGRLTKQDMVWKRRERRNTVVGPSGRRISRIGPGGVIRR